MLAVRAGMFRYDFTGVNLGGIPLSRAPHIFRRNTRFAGTVIRPDYHFLPRFVELILWLAPTVRTCTRKPRMFSNITMFEYPRMFLNGHSFTPGCHKQAWPEEFLFFVCFIVHCYHEKIVIRVFLLNRIFRTSVCAAFFTGM